MRPASLAGIIVIYIGVCSAWVILGASVWQRTQTSREQLRSQVAGLWGTPLEQRAPQLTVQETVPYPDEKGRRKTKTVSHELVPVTCPLERA